MINIKPTQQQRRELLGLGGRFLLVSSFFCVLLFLVVPKDMQRFTLTNYVLFALIFLPALSLQILNPDKRYFHSFFTKAGELHKDLEHNQKLYLNVFLFGLVTAYLYVTTPAAYSQAVFLLYACYCYGIAIFDIIRAYKWLSESLIGKALIAIGFALGSNLAFSMAGWVISGMTNAPSSVFPHTKSFVAIGTIPFLLIIAGAVLNVVLFAVAPVIMMASTFAESQPKLMQFVLGTQLAHRSRRYVFITFCFQVIFYVILLGIAPRLAEGILDRNSKNIESIISHSIYLFDMHPAKECKLKGTYRYAALGDENYLPATETAGTVAFESPVKCEVSLSDSSANNP